MASSSQHHPSQACNSKHPKMEFVSPTSPPLPPLKNHPTTSTYTDHLNPNPCPTADVATLSPDDIYLSKSAHLTRHEVIRRRSHCLRQLIKCYRDHYWLLMEQLRVQYRDYVWKYGKSPFKNDEEDAGDFVVEGSGETNTNVNGASANNLLLCAFYGCKLKAMALTSFCQLHILSDAKQHLYKPCDYVIKSAQAGPLTCGKPILRSSFPSLCSVHFQKAQKDVTRALKKASLNVSSSSKLAPKLHVIVAEYVHEIQSKRKAALRASRNKVVAKQEHGS